MGEHFTDDPETRKPLDGKQHNDEPYECDNTDHLPDELEGRPDHPDLEYREPIDQPEQQEPPQPAGEQQIDETALSEDHPPPGNGPPPHPPQSPGEEPENEDEVIRQYLEDIDHLKQHIDMLIEVFMGKGHVSLVMDELIDRKVLDLTDLQDMVLEVITRAQTRRQLGEKELELLSEAGQPPDNPEPIPPVEDMEVDSKQTWTKQVWPDMEGTDISEIAPSPGPSLPNTVDLSEHQARIKERAAFLAQAREMNLESLRAFEEDVAFLRARLDPEASRELEADFTDSREQVALRGIYLAIQQRRINRYFAILKNADTQNTEIDNQEYWQTEGWI